MLPTGFERPDPPFLRRVARTPRGSKGRAQVAVAEATSRRGCPCRSKSAAPMRALSLSPSEHPMSPMRARMQGWSARSRSSPTKGRRRYVSPRRETAARRPRCFPPPGTDAHEGLLPLRSPEGPLPTRFTPFEATTGRIAVRRRHDDGGNLAEKRATTPLLPHAFARFRLRRAMLPAGRPLAERRLDPFLGFSSERSSRHRAARSFRTGTGNRSPTRPRIRKGSRPFGSKRPQRP